MPVNVIVLLVAVAALVVTFIPWSTIWAKIKPAATVEPVVPVTTLITVHVLVDAFDTLRSNLGDEAAKALDESVWPAIGKFQK
ncbi:MAG: hypothetical protein KKB31_07990 [Nanoarchaeota archaeon]|nr:hypothetical protein [Nanoarchaeota archaeon]